MKALAELVIKVLDAQQIYFRTRTKESLVTSKKLEKELRDLANATLAGNLGGTEAAVQLDESLVNGSIPFPRHLTVNMLVENQTLTPGVYQGRLNLDGKIIYDKIRDLTDEEKINNSKGGEKK